MKLQHLRTFVVVFQEKSFTSAAARIYATQSGLSMQIKELEEDLGVQLFERSTRGVLPTAAGMRYYDHALKVLRELEDARRDVRQLNGELLGSISVGAMPTFSRAVLAPALSEFAITHPYVTVKVTEAYSGVLTDGVAREEFDFAIVPPGGADPRVESQYVSRDRELFVTRGGDSAGHLSPIVLRRQSPLKLVVPTRGNARRARVEEYLTAIGAQIDSLLEMDAMMGTLELIAISDWSAILPATLCYPDRSGQARSLRPIVDPPLFVDYVRITPVSRMLGPAALAFAEGLTTHIRRIAEDWDTLLKGM